jgi:hypothetical protein
MRKKKSNRRGVKPEEAFRFLASTEYRLVFRDVDQLRVARIAKKHAPPGFPLAVVDGSQVVAFVASEKVGKTLMLGLWLGHFIQAEVSNSLGLLKARIRDAF